MTIKKTGLITTILGAASMAVACGSSGVSSGVPGNKTGEEITDDEAEMLCEATFDYMETQITDQRQCELSAGVMAAVETAGSGDLDDEALQQACQEATDECVENGDAEMLIPDSTCTGAMGSVEECTATVSEIELCLTESIDGAAEQLDELPTCSDMTVGELADLALNSPEFDVETPESCETVEEKCPGSGFGSDPLTMDSVDMTTDDSTTDDGTTDGMGGASN